MLPDARPQEPNILDRVIGYLSPAWAKRRAADRFMAIATQYRSAATTRLLSNWALGQEDATPDAWELSTLRERSRDLNRNDPVASGATETMSINIVGHGLQPQARIRAERIGIDEGLAKKLNRQAESIWQDWSARADNANKLDFDEIQFLALRKIIEDGESIAIPTMAPDKWRKIKRSVELIEADRLESSQNVQGITFGSRGEPKTYHIKSTNDKGKIKYNDIPALDKYGRPKILHVFPTKRPGQRRGVPYFAPVISHFKHLADYLEAEVVAMRVAACLAIFITKDDPMSAAYNTSTSTETGTGKRIQGIEPGMVDYLGVGESINVVDPKRPGDNFAPFLEGILRLIGVSLGLPYEILVKDFSKTNYSSARAALLEGRRLFMTWRRWFARRFCQPLYDLVLEEAYLRDMFDAPRFYDFRSEYTRAAWIGGAWGWVDPVKEVDSSRKAIDYGLSTLAEEAAGQGRDWEEILEQQAREKQRAKDLGITLSTAGKNESSGNEKEGDNGTN